MSTVSEDLIDRAVDLMQSAVTVDRQITAGTFVVVGIDDARSALAGAGKPYPFSIMPNSVRWSFPEPPGTMAVDQRWDILDFSIDVRVSAYGTDQTKTTKDCAALAYEIRRSLGDSESWTSVAGFVEVDVLDAVVEAVSTEYAETGEGQDYIYVLRQPLRIQYREDHS